MGRVSAACVAGFVAWLLAAAPAQASRAEIITVDVGDRIDVILEEQLIVTARRGEANRFVLRELGGGRVEVRDTGARLRAGTSCRPRGRHRAVCTPDDVIVSVDVSAGDRGDRVLVRNLEARVFGEEGDDRLTGGSSFDQLDGGPGADRLVGKSGDDDLDGGPGRDTLRGGPGNDTLGADDGPRGAQADRLDGGRGRDAASWAGSRRRVVARLAGGRVRGTRDRGERIEGLRGGAAGDRLTGGGGDDLLAGNGGSDTLIGRGGDDELVPGHGREFNDVRCGRGRDAVSGPQLWTYVRGDCERIESLFSRRASIEPRMRLRPGGRLEVAAFCGTNTIVCFLDTRISSPPGGVPGVPRGAKRLRLAPVLREPKGRGRTTLTFRLSDAGRRYLGNGGKPVCVTDDESGYCVRVPRRGG